MSPPRQGQPPVLRPAWMGPILRGVVTTPDLAGSVEAYRRGLGLSVRRRGTLPAGVARAWGAPAATGARFAVLAPVSRVGGDIQLVAGPTGPAAGPAPLRSHGWAALELSVADLDAAVAGLTADFTVLGAPGALSGPAGALRAAQVVGPAGEVIYLTELRRPLPPFRLPPRARGPGADGVFVAVLAASDLESTRRWWERDFPVRRCTDRLATVGVLNRAFSRPPEATTRISSLQLSGRSVVEIDQYPAAATGRRVPEGGLPAGIALVSLGVPGGVPVGASESGAPESGAPGRNPGRVLLRGPDGELVELVPAPRPIDVLRRRPLA